MMDVMKYASRKTLIVYLYREETDRLMSAIRFVAKTTLCGQDVSRMQNWEFWKFFPHLLPKQNNATTITVVDKASIKAKATETLGILERTSTSCTLDETKFLEQTIQPQVAEIGFSTHRHLNHCPLWQELEDNAPSMLYLDYKESSNLQSQLALHFCPRVTTKRENEGQALEHATTKKNATSSVSGSNHKEHYIRLGNGQRVLLDDWVDAKRSTIEFVLKTSSGGSCKWKTRGMEDAMRSCADRALFYQ